MHVRVTIDYLVHEIRSRIEAAGAQLTEAVKKNAEVDPDIAYSVASVYALEEARDEAFEWLGRSIALGNENRPCFENDPNWAALRDDPRFAELLSRVRVPGKSKSPRS